MFETYNVMPCPEGPHTTPIVVAMTPGSIAGAILARLVCTDPVTGLPNTDVPEPSVDVDSVIHIHPMIAVVKVQRPDPNNKFIQICAENLVNTKDHFGEPMTTPEETYFRAKHTLEALDYRFGHTFDFSPMENLDLTGKPFIYNRFIDDFYSLFVTQKPFTPCSNDMWSGFQWNVPLAEGIVEEMKSPDRYNTTRTIEEWYASALAITLIDWVESQ